MRYLDSFLLNNVIYSRSLYGQTLLLCWDSPMAWSCDVPLWLWLVSALDEAVAMSYTTVGNLQKPPHTRTKTNRTNVKHTTYIRPVGLQIRNRWTLQDSNKTQRSVAEVQANSHQHLCLHFLKCFTSCLQVMNLHPSTLVNAFVRPSAYTNNSGNLYVYSMHVYACPVTGVNTPRMHWETVCERSDPWPR